MGSKLQQNVHEVRDFSAVIGRLKSRTWPSSEGEPFKTRVEWKQNILGGIDVAA